MDVDERWFRMRYLYAFHLASMDMEEKEMNGMEYHGWQEIIK